MAVDKTKILISEARDFTVKSSITNKLSKWLKGLRGSKKCCSSININKWVVSYISITFCSVLKMSYLKQGNMISC